MGGWGAGNFQNDSALDVVGDVLKLATSEIDAFCVSDQVGVEDLDGLLAYIEIHLALFEKCCAGGPHSKTVGVLRKKVLQIFDEQIDLLDPQDDYKATRREVLQETLERYARAVDSENAPDD